jgi:hypothetical protein
MTVATTDERRQAWNIAPEDSHSWTGLDSPPITTEQMVPDSRSDSNAAAQPPHEAVTADHSEAEASDLGLSLN